MGDEVIIVSVIFSAVVAIVFMGIASDIIKAWIKNRKSTSITGNEEFLEALREFKEKTDKRLSNLETIASQDDDGGNEAENGPGRNLFDLNDQPGNREADTAGKKLKNMLKG